MWRCNVSLAIVITNFHSFFFLSWPKRLACATCFLEQLNRFKTSFSLFLWCTTHWFSWCLVMWLLWMFEIQWMLLAMHFSQKDSNPYYIVYISSLLLCVKTCQGLVPYFFLVLHKRWPSELSGHLVFQWKWRQVFSSHNSKQKIILFRPNSTVKHFSHHRQWCQVWALHH